MKCCFTYVGLLIGVLVAAPAFSQTVPPLAPVPARDKKEKDSSPKNISAVKADNNLSTPPATAAPHTANLSPASSKPTIGIDAAYNLKIRELEERVNELKMKIFQSKARLLSLQEAVLHGIITGASAVLIHRNIMGGSYKLIQATYHLDGAPIFNKVDESGDLDKKKEFKLFNGTIKPGPHTLSVYLVYQGAGFLPYLNKYKFRLKSSYTFPVEEGKITRIKIVGYEKGGVWEDWKNRPSVRYDVEVISAREQAAKQGKTGKSKSKFPKVK